MPGRVAVHGVNLDGDDQAGRPGAYLRIIEPGSIGEPRRCARSAGAECRYRTRRGRSFADTITPAISEPVSTR